MRKTNEGSTPAGVLLPAGAAGLLTTLLLMLVGAVLVHRGTLGRGRDRPVRVGVSGSKAPALAGLIAVEACGRAQSSSGRLVPGAWFF